MYMSTNLIHKYMFLVAKIQSSFLYFVTKPILKFFFLNPYVHFPFLHLQARDGHLHSWAVWWPSSGSSATVL